MQLVADGADEFGKLTILVPGKCCNCKGPVEVSVRYRNIPQLSKNLRERGLLITKVPSLLLKKPWEIGVSCGCYARFHRQVAHVEDKRNRVSRG